MTQHRDTRIQQLVQRPPAAAPDGSPAAERVRPAKLFATALDALVRAAATPGAPGQATVVSGMAARACEAGRAIAGQTLAVEAVGITLDGDMVLPCTPDNARWILPVWLAGLRSVTTLPDLREEDVRLFAGGLALAGPGPEAVDNLASWLWSSPADGLRLETRACAVERIEAVSGTPDAARAALRASWLETAGKLLAGSNPFASQTETTTARERAWWERLNTGDLVLTRDVRYALRASADDDGAVLRLELMTAMAQEPWQATLQPALVARMVTRLAARTYDRDLNSLTGMLAADTGDYGRICVAELAAFPVGDALATATTLEPGMSDDKLAAIQAVLQQQPEATASGLLRGLLERVATDPEGLVPVLARLMALVSAGTFLRLAQPATLSAQVRPLVGRILLAAVPTAEELSVVCASLPVSAFVEVLRATPIAALAPLVPALATVLGAADAREKAAIVLYLTDPARASELPVDAVVALTSALVGAQGQGWDVRSVRLVAESALRVNENVEGLFSLQRSPKASPAVRVAVLDALARSAEHAPEALKWRMGEMFDAPEVRDRLVELRARRPA